MANSNPFKKANNTVPKTVIPEMPAEEPKPVTPPPVPSQNDDLVAALKPKKTEAKTYGFYLDDDVVAAVEKLAKQAHTSKSKVVNTVLRNALIKGE